MGQVKIIASPNLAPEIKLERLDLNNFGPWPIWPTRPDLLWPTMLTYNYPLLANLPSTSLPTAGCSHKIIQAFLATNSPNHDVSLNWPHSHHCSQSFQTASTPLDTIATLWLVRGPKEGFLSIIYCILAGFTQDLSFKNSLQLSIVFTFSFFSF